MAGQTTYTQELADQICEKIATSNRGLRSILQDKGMPAMSTVMKWLSENKEFSEQYARAREIQADFLADEIIEISDDSSADTIQTENGSMENKEWVNRSKLRVDARKWIASKLKPKKYGDKLDVTTDGEKITSFKVGFKRPEAGDNIQS